MAAVEKFGAACMVRATDTCSFDHGCLYLFNFQQRVNKNSNIQKLSRRVQKETSIFKRKKKETLERTFLCILLPLLMPGLSLP